MEPSAAAGRLKPGAVLETGKQVLGKQGTGVFDHDITLNTHKLPAMYIL